MPAETEVGNEKTPDGAAASLSDDDRNESSPAGEPEIALEISSPPGVIYTVDDIPQWYLCILLGFQHYLTAVGGMITTPFLLAQVFCMDDDRVALSEIMGTTFFVSGLITLLQTTFGVRLPIIQGGSFSFLPPTFAIMAQAKWSCPYTEARSKYGHSVNFTSLGLPEIGSEGHRDIWTARICEIQGAIIVSALLGVAVGFSGVMGLALRYIGPLAIAPTISLIGLSLFTAGADNASGHWWIALLTMILIGLFSQYMGGINVPFFYYKPGHGCKTFRLKIFSLFPVLFSMIIAWLVCVILTATDVLPDNPDKWGYLARTDTKIGVLNKASWFRFPYPGQWGAPTFTTSSILGMLAAIIASMIEAVGDYYACARLSGAPPPPVHAVNRGVGVEGIGCILAGIWGTGNGTTSYSENIGAIGITKVGSRRVVQTGGLIMLVLGCLGKFGALFATIPTPVVGGMFMIAFGMVTAVGLSSLQFVDLNSPRNIFILGVSMYFGLAMPTWMSNHTDAIDTGSDIADQILSVLLSTNMFVGGLLGFVLDNTIPGTDEERGIIKWRAVSTDGSGAASGGPGLQVYDLPRIQPWLDKVALFRYLPFCPSFLAHKDKADKETEQTGADEGKGVGEMNDGLTKEKNEMPPFENPMFREDDETSARL